MLDVWSVLSVPLWQAILALLLLLVLRCTLEFMLRLPRLSNLNKRYVLVTGCDSGLGQQLVFALDRLGCHVFAGCLTSEGVEVLKTKCGPKVHVLSLDVTSTASIQECRRNVLAILPDGKGLWGLVNNAGLTGALGPHEWLPRSEYEKVFAVNVFGGVEMTNTFMPLLRKGRGRLVNTASILGRVPAPYSGAYCMSKFAVEAFSDNVRTEMRASGVSVHILEPGSHRTNLTLPEIVCKKVQDTFNDLDLDVQEHYGKNYPSILMGMHTSSIKYLGVLNPLHGVEKAYLHALFARFPQRRYQVGVDAKLMVLLTFMPAFVTDWIYVLLAPKPGQH